MTIVAGVVQPDYAECVDAPVGNVVIVEGPPGPEGPEGPQGPPGEPGTSCPLFCGIGSPEGVVTSSIGGMYEQTDAASTSHSIWHKHSGVGNTGWRQWAGLRGGDGANTALRIGDNSVASGVDSVAIGENAEATGISAIALGKNTLASGARSEAFGQDSEATADDAKAFGAGALASAASAVAVGKDANASAVDAIAIGNAVIAAGVSGIAIGTAARVDGADGIAIGDGQARDVSDIIIGFGNNIGQALAHANIVIGKTATIGTTADSASPTASTRGGHIVIGENASAGMGPSAFPNTIIGRDASSVGRAVVVIGQGAQARAADTPVAGQVEGRFATIVGYLAKGSGGCIVSVGDQVDVRGDSAVAVGTHARANDSNCTAIGPNAWAGSVVSDTTGQYAVAVGPGATARGARSISISGGSSPAVAGIGIGYGHSINAAHYNAVVIGENAFSAGPRTLNFGDFTWPIHAIHFNGSPNPALLVNMDGSVSLVSPGQSAQVQPFTADYTLTPDEPVAFVSASAGARVITLPASTGSERYYVVRKEDASGNTVTVVPSGADTIDGDPNFVLAARYNYVILFDDGSVGFEWDVVDSG